MRALNDSDFLNLWETGFRRHPLDRALLTLGAALPETPYESLADWPLGRRNKALAELRCSCFGHGLRAWIACTHCAEKLEFEMDGRVLAGEGLEGGRGSEEPIFVNGRAFRLPTSRDLALTAGESNPVVAAIRLVDSCRVEAGESSGWTEEELDEIGERMAFADPLAETRLTLNCPKCGNEWEETIDIASFLWEEIEARVRRLLFAIHTLASAYGWAEAEILSLSENRRALYLEMVQS
jgi:hypothetical protein